MGKRGLVFQKNINEINYQKKMIISTEMGYILNGNLRELVFNK